ncbi:primosomal protein N' [uncultured Cocleimonas sp.]|uniref:primosomal protein N' n=1 Tax=uncultured Cocleimonas sp. TaxID=1051587 RepID=UPI00261BB1AB|nr:primosomal protein N' [uncultured Cocleimonas sp.]
MSQESFTNVVRVAIQRPLYMLLDYSCDSELHPEPGCRVRVSLGNSVITGIVVETGVESEFKTLKPIIEILDQSPLIDEKLLSLLHWSSSYYFHPLGEVLFHALPVDLRKGKNVPKIEIWNVTKAGLELLEGELKRAPKQQAMLDYVIQKVGADANGLKQLLGDNWRSTSRELIKKELVTIEEIDPQKITTPANHVFSVNPPHHLTEEQQQCLTDIDTHFKEPKLLPILLHGITGSGKTEVYLSVIAPILKAKKQVLVLIPEIGLTPQLLSRFRQYFPDSNIDCLHSGLADGERTRVWLGAKSGSIDIVIGTRSAVFTPLLNPGMILIDEEHDASFKQQEGFLYQGRDMAIKRAHDLSIPILLGSATPSLESLYNVEKERYHYLRLNNRPGASNPPDIALQDIRTLPLDAGISSLMMTDIRQHLDNNNQVMLFLNRRGFAPVLMCQDCGWHAVCSHCDMGMTYHASMGKIICHHCGYEERVKSTCPDCSSTKLTTQGQGTERIEEVLNTHFPETPVIRIDRDSTSRKGSLEEKLELVNSGEPVILIGTQMLTKGHDFPKLTLVGILDVDQALFSMDYRAHERLAQQVLQVAGRAGRGEAKGKVILQTSQPQHPMLLSLLSQGYASTAQQILNERKLWNYPPLGCQALVRVNALDLQLAHNFISTLGADLAAINSEKVMLLGPMPSPLARRAKRYRFQLLISAEKRGDLHGFLHSVLSIISKIRKTGGVRWMIDVDPVDFL